MRRLLKILVTPGALLLYAVSLVLITMGDTTGKPELRLMEVSICL